jgi:rare lipoprotein A
MKEVLVRVVVVSAVLALGASAASAQTAASAPASAPAAEPAKAPAAASVETGKIAWYGSKFAGRRTASGERYNPEAMTVAHKSLPFGTWVLVTNTANGKSVKLRVNDRGPTQADRIADVSYAAARKLGFVRAGLTEASIEVATAPARKP